MALLKAAALAATAAIALPFVLRNETGMLAGLADYGTVRPIPGQFGITFSIPLFIGIGLFAFVLFKLTER